MAAQVLSGSAAWWHDTVAVAAVGEDVVSVGDVWLVAAPAAIPPMIASRAAESEGDISSALIAVELEAGKVSVPVDESI